jgi:hypothetical protein
VLNLLKLFDGGPMGGGGMVFFQSAEHVLRVIPFAMLGAVLLTLLYILYLDRRNKNAKDQSSGNG